MGLTYGFYNAELKNGEMDRTYDAEDFGRLFDGLITDGVFKGFGDSFKVRKQSEKVVTVGTGKAWFNGTWTLLDEPINTTLQGSSMWAVVLEVNKQSRTNKIRFVSFGNSLELVRDDSLRIYQYCLAYVRCSDSGGILSVESHIGQGSENITPWAKGLLGGTGGGGNATLNASVYTTGVKFTGSSGFDLTFKDTNGLSYVNKFKITEQNGKISKITNSTTGRSINVSYE